MKVKDLIAKLAECPPDAEVVVTAFDHGYSRVTHATPTVADITTGGRLSEAYEGSVWTKADVVVLE